MSRPEGTEWVQAEFDTRTSEHVLTVLHDDGLHRHLRCRKPGMVLWGWDVITWPGYLALTGDLGSWMFSRAPDMLLDFFRGPPNVHYWLEKVVAHDRGTSFNVVSRELIAAHRRDDDASDEAWTEALALADDLDGTSETSQMIEHLMRYIDGDAWDWTITVPSVHAQRALCAIVWTRQAYLAIRETRNCQQVSTR